MNCFYPLPPACSQTVIQCTAELVLNNLFLKHSTMKALFPINDDVTIDLNIVFISLCFVLLSYRKIKIKKKRNVCHSQTQRLLDQGREKFQMCRRQNDVHLHFLPHYILQFMVMPAVCFDLYDTPWWKMHSALWF